METASIELWHGSSHVIKHPEYGLVKPNNDYGRGFYCTRRVELAKEWACAGLDDGFANRYTLTTDGLLFLDLSQPDASQADVIVGYRADDSYFSFARAFVNNAISIDQLAEAMRLGELGKQIVLASPQAFAALRFQGCEIARASTYHGLRNERDRTAREAYRRKSAEADLDGLFMRDIIREKVTNDDPRL